MLGAYKLKVYAAPAASCRLQEAARVCHLLAYIGTHLCALLL